MLLSRHLSAYRLACLAVLLLAAVVRFWGLSERGLYYHDEGGFMANAVFYGGMVRAAAGQLVRGRLDLGDLGKEAERLYREGGTPSQTAKPLYYLLLTSATVLLGPHDWVGLGLSALAGVFTVWLVLRLPLPGAPPGTNLAAGLLLALSVWHTHYCRAALSQAVSLLLVTLVIGLLLAIERDRGWTSRRVIGAGLTVGLAFTTHYNLFWLPLAVSLWVAWRVGTATHWNGWVLLGQALRLGAAMALPLLLFELGYSAFVPAARQALAGGVHADKALFLATYVEQIHFQLTCFRGNSTLGSAGFAYLPSVLRNVEGVLLLSLFGAGMLLVVVRAVRGGDTAVLLGLLGLTPLVLWSLGGWPAPRSYITALVPFALAAGWLLAWLWEKAHTVLNARRWCVVAALLLAAWVVGEQMPRLTALARAQSPYRRACERLSALVGTDASPVLLADRELGSFPKPIYRFYLGAAVVRDSGTASFFLLDHTPASDELESHLRNAATTLEPVMEVEGDLRDGMLLEDNLPPSYIDAYRAGEVPLTISVYRRQTVP